MLSICFAVFRCALGACDILWIALPSRCWKTNTSIGKLLSITADHITRESIPFSRAIVDRVILIDNRPNLVGYPRIEVISRRLVSS